MPTTGPASRLEADSKIAEVFVQGRLHEARRLLDSGFVDPNARVCGSETFLLYGTPSLLRYVIWCDQPEVAHLLLSRRADPRIDDDDGVGYRPFLCEVSSRPGKSMSDVAEHVLELGLCRDQVLSALRAAINTSYHTWPSVEVLVLAHGDGPLPFPDNTLNYLQWRHHDYPDSNWEAFERTRKLQLVSE